MRIYTEYGEIREDTGKIKALGEYEIIEEITTTTENGKKKKRVLNKTKILFGKEDYAAVLIGLLILYGIYSGALTVEQTIAIVAATFLGWGGYSYNKSNEVKKPAESK